MANYLSPLRLAKGIKVAHVTTRYAPFAGGSNNVTGNYVRHIASYQGSRGADVYVFLPRFGDLDVSRLEFLGSKQKSELSFMSQTHTLDVENVQIKVPEEGKAREMDGLDEHYPHLFLVTNNELFGACRYDKGFGENLASYVFFQMAVLKYIKDSPLTPNYLHFHGVDMGLGPAMFNVGSINEMSSKLASMHSVFSPHSLKDPALFPLETINSLGLPAEMFRLDGIEYYHNFSMLKAGMQAPTIFINQNELAAQLADTNKEITAFVTNRIKQMKVIAVAKNEPSDPDNNIFPFSLGRGVLEFYRSLAPNYSLNLFMAALPDFLEGNYSIDAFLRNVRQTEVDRPRVVRETMINSNDVFTKQIGYKNVIGQGLGTQKPRPSTASSIIGLFSDFSAEINYDGRIVIVLDGGEGTRNWGINLAEGCIKGMIQVLGKRLAEVAASQTLPIFLQLPNKGLGWGVVSGCDNVLITDRITVGGRPLHEAPFGIVLFGQPIDVSRMTITDKGLKDLERLGVCVPHPDTGELKVFLEKVKAHVILNSVLESRGNYCYKNTFFMAVRSDIRRKMVELYSIPTMSNEPSKACKPLFELGLDWARHIIEPMCVTKDEWMNGSRKYGMNKEDKNVAIEDWGALWDKAQELKKAAGGVGMANIGENSLWLDTGVNEELYNLYFSAAEGDTPNNARVRQLFGLPVDLDTYNSFDRNVIKPSEPRSFICMDSVFKNGGKIGKGSVIIGSIFDEYIEIPNDTIIIGSHLGKIKTQKSAEIGGMLYNYNGTNEPFEFAAGQIYMTIYPIVGESINATHPLEIDPNQEVERDRDFKEQPIFKRRSFNQLMSQISLGRTLAAQRSLTNEITAFVRSQSKYED